MNIPALILSILGIAAIAGTLAAYFRRSTSRETERILQANIEALKDSEKLKDQRIAYLEGQVYSKDETIKKLSKS